jgi:hypothetical protein
MGIHWLLRFEGGVEDLVSAEVDGFEDVLLPAQMRLALERLADAAEDLLAGQWIVATHLRSRHQ